MGQCWHYHYLRLPGNGKGQGCFQSRFGGGAHIPSDKMIGQRSGEHLSSGEDQGGCEYHALVVTNNLE